MPKNQAIFVSIYRLMLWPRSVFAFYQKRRDKDIVAKEISYPQNDPSYFRKWLTAEYKRLESLSEKEWLSEGIKITTLKTLLIQAICELDSSDFNSSIIPNNQQFNISNFDLVRFEVGVFLFANDEIWQHMQYETKSKEVYDECFKQFLALTYKALGIETGKLAPLVNYRLNIYKSILSEEKDFLGTLTAFIMMSIETDGPAEVLPATPNLNFNQTFISTAIAVWYKNYIPRLIEVMENKMAS